MRLPAMLTLVALLAGCAGDSVCVQWSESEGACPSRADALALVAPSCEEPISSVDSDGEREGDACCYEVSHADEAACPE